MALNLFNYFVVQLKLVEFSLRWKVDSYMHDTGVNKNQMRTKQEREMFPITCTI